MCCHTSQCTSHGRCPATVLLRQKMLCVMLRVSPFPPFVGVPGAVPHLPVLQLPPCYPLNFSVLYPKYGPRVSCSGRVAVIEPVRIDMCGTARAVILPKMPRRVADSGEMSGREVSVKR